MIIILTVKYGLSMVSQALHSSAKERDCQADSQMLLRIRHTCAHVLAMAVQTLFPEMKDAARH